MREYTLRVKAEHQGCLPGTGSAEAWAVHDDGPDHRLLSTWNLETFRLWKDHMRAQGIPFEEVAD